MSTEFVAALPIDLILWAAFGFILIVFAVYSLVLLWHWKEYSTGRFTTTMNMFVYLGVSLGCLALMALAALWYSLI